MADITLWLPETRTVIHQALGKAAEESAELSKIAVRCMIQGLDAVDPVTGKPNRKSLADELADVEATTEWLFELLSLDVEAHNARATRKLEGFRRWQAMIEAHEAHALPPADDHSRVADHEGQAADKRDPVDDSHGGVLQKKSSEGTMTGEQLASPTPHEDLVGEQVDYPKILYVCENCFEHNEEACGNDRDRINVTPDGRWLCDDCRDGEGIDVGLCRDAPTLYSAPSPQLREGSSHG